MRRGAGETIRFGYRHATRLGAVGPNSSLGSRFGAFGAGSLIGFPHGAIYGESNIHIGHNTLIASRVTLSVGMTPDQVMLSSPVIKIGDNCLIGQGSAIVGHYDISIGDQVYTGMNVYITDQNHGYENLDESIGRQTPSEQPVRIGARSWIGSGAVILPGADIGEHVVVAANAVVRGHIPDRCVVAGVPARIVRQYDGNTWQTHPHPSK